METFMMPRKWTITVMVTSGLLLAGAAQAQTTSTVKATTTTSSTSSTSTTLAPHPFSKATKACIKQAKAELNACTAGRQACNAAYRTAYANCFASPSCVTKCQTASMKCYGAAPATRKACKKTCVANKKADTKACELIPKGDTIWAGGDQGCLVTKNVNFNLCRFSCSQTRANCNTNFTFCIANCPNL